MIVSGTREHGFVLAITLWILTVITIGAAFFAQRVGASIALAQQSQQTTEAMMDLASTRAEILFRLATTRLSVYGLGPTLQSAIALDDRPYRGTGDDTVRLQDSAGLINVNFVQPEMLLRLLGQMGVPAENRDVLLDTLNDYTDTDDFRRLNGAEAAEYRARGLLPPPNDFLVTPWQLQNIIGWKEQTTLWKDQRLFEIVTTARVLSFNPNTAPREVLATLPGSSLENADSLIRLRTVNPFTRLSQLGSLVDRARMDSDSVFFVPSNTVQLTQESDKIPGALRSQIVLTPQGSRAPWRIDYSLRTSVSSKVPNTNELPPLPSRVAYSATPE